MRASIVSIGNSKGIRIPKVLLEESGISEDVELKAKKGEIRITAIIASKRVSDSLKLSESALAADWNRPEEKEAWKDLK